MSQLSETVDNYRPTRRKRGSHPNAKLTQEEVDEIRRLAGEDVSRASLVARFGVSKSTIGSILRGTTWGRVEVQKNAE